jgi:lycopene elongase/hydratase (dihydrobisanhydrobacterioruberin-forming)
MPYISALINTYRPILLPVPPIIFGLAFFLSGGILSPIVILQILIITFLAPILVFGINDVFDHETDKLNPRKATKLLDEITIKRNHKTIIFGSIAVSILLILSSFLTLNFNNLVFMSIALSVAWLYSTPPIQLKTKPLGDIFSNILGLLSIAGLGASFGSLYTLFQIIPPERIVGIILALIMASLIAGLADFNSDQATGQTTTAVFIGKKMTAILGLLATLPLGLINFQEAGYLKISIFAIILAYLPLLWLYKNSKIVSLVYFIITLITVLSFAVYLVYVLGIWD